MKNAALQRNYRRNFEIFEKFGGCSSASRTDRPHLYLEGGIKKKKRKNIGGIKSR